MSTNNPEPINDNLITTLIKEIKSLRAELNDLRSGLETTKIQLNPKALYNNKEIRLLLGVDERLVKKYRDNGLLSYIRESDKYWYLGSDVIAFLNGSWYEAFAFREDMSRDNVKITDFWSQERI